MTALAMTADDFSEEDREDDVAAPRRYGNLALGVSALLVLLAGAWMTLRLSGAAGVTQLQIEGEFERVTAAEVAAEVRPFLVTRFSELDLESARRALERLPWVARVRVERVWPETLRVRVWERQPFARWNDDALLDREAQVFRPKLEGLAAELPQLRGGAGSEAVVATMFQTLAQRLQSTPFALAGLARDARGEWTARTRDGVELRFGRGDPVQALEAVMQPMQQALQERMTLVNYVDLRYTNGFSVGWRPAPQTLPEPADGGQGG
ncbi:MAG TPA: cell division protein FtsQ/DivIB [Solimonas sp.]|nr:cell division protein FtsQ/DivIB [Solimonas sp.]